MTPREEVLSRISAAIATPEPDSVTEVAPQSVPAYRTCGDPDRSRLLDLLEERLIDYRATVRRAAAAGLAAAVGTALTQRGARRVVVPPGLDLPALPAGCPARRP